MGSTSIWFLYNGSKCQFVPSKSGISPNARRADGDVQQLHPLIYNWSEDREFHDDPEADLAAFYLAYFKQLNEVALGLGATDVKPDAEERTCDLPLSIVRERSQTAGAQRLQLLQVG
jgi:hypothetical protein